jgi:UDP-3-O-[3-hydroxymyristoyl] glucosamine N-acyltransferase
MSQFFPRPAGMTVRDIAGLTGARPRDGADLEAVVVGIAPLERARPADLVFVESAKFLPRLAASRAGVCLTTELFAEAAPAGISVLHSAEPFRDFVMVARRLYPQSLRPLSLYDAEAVGPGAVLHPSAEIEDGAVIDPNVVIGPRAGIGQGTVIAPNAVIGPDVQIGRDCSIGAGVAIVHALIGDHVIVHAGCRIGQDGFRYHPTAAGHLKVPQLGRVIIQDHVEIGANTTIDRGGSGDTVIGEGTKIDNLVQIGHNCTIGRHVIVVAECGISGSVTIGDYAVIGGQVGVADHVNIGERAMIGAQSGVMTDIPPGEKWLGYPAVPRRDFLRRLGAHRSRR